MTGPVTLAAGLSFGNAGWLLPVLALWGVALALCLRFHHRLPRALRSPAGLALRIAGLTIVALALLEPSWSKPRARRGANFFAVLADDSRSLQLPGSSGDPRKRQLQALLAGDRPWQRALGEIHQLRRYRFAERLERVPDFAGLRFEGRASHLGSALATLADRFRGAPLAGVLLFTDGNATDVDQTPPDLSGLPPIYAVLPEAAGRAPDVAVSRVSASETLFEDAPISVEAEIETSGLRGQSLAVELRDQRDTLLETQRLTPAADQDRAAVRFRVRPDATEDSKGGKPAAAPASLHYRVAVRAPDGRPELTAANNSRSVVVPRPRGPARLLYVGGRPSWEYKFLRRALESDRLLHLVALVRMAPREPKFAFLTRQGETANPLFRGFGAGADDAERFDEPVLLRLGTRDAKELEGGFPKTPEALFEYQAVILDDLEAGFFTAAQQALVERFVSERGGGLLMLGGLGSFRQGGYDRTPIGDLLPVYLDRPSGAGAAGPLPAARLTLTREGWLEAWARLRDNENDERARLAAMPPFKVLSRARGLKPGATVLAALEPARGAREGQPALVVQRAGEGRAAAITVGDLWRWALRRAQGEPEDLGKFWRQTLRALVADVPHPVAVNLAPRPGEAGALAVEVRVRGRDFRPADGAKVDVEAVAPDGTRTPLPVQPAGNQAGTYQAVLRPQGAGVFRVHASARGADGHPLGEGSAGRPLDLDADEHRSVRPNLGLLEALARQTGGAVIAAGELDDFVRRLADRPAPVSDLDTRPLWHSWLVLLVALACFAAEWALRRRRGLP